jgi:septal ring factor EnvC (AmiA/AmiB activator)
MKRPFYIALILTCVLSCWWIGASLWSQNKKEVLTQQRDEITAKINETKSLIAQSEKKQKLTSSQIAVLNEQIRYRESMINTIENELVNMDQTIQKESSQIKTLEFQLDALKAEYGKMIYNAYKNRSSYSELVFLFAADDFYQAYRRFKIMQALGEGRRRQVESITHTEKNLALKVNDLQENRVKVASLKTEQIKEKSEIDQDKKVQQIKLQELKKEEKKLRNQQKKQEADRKKLTAKIQEAIAQELEKERIEAEKIAKAQALAMAKKNTNTASEAASTTKNNAASNTNSSSNTAKSTKSSAVKIELAPEVISLNSNFENNKGSLPWPVKSGAITSHFGKHAHPTLEDIVLNNNGVDFTTKTGEPVQCVFGGKVTSVFAIPGAGWNIIITHGTYKTVYAGLAVSQVKVGDQVSARQTIGTVGEQDDESVLHFELWAVNTTKGVAQNPELWIKRK